MRRLILVLPFLSCAVAQAHPVPKQNHDRIIVVRISADALIVDYRLEVDRDGWTIARDLKEALPNQEDWAGLTTEAKVYDAFARAYAPLIAGNLTIKLDGRDLVLDQGPLAKPVLADSVQFPFTFRKSWKLQPGQRHQLTFYEGSYEIDEGQIKVSIVSDGTVQVLEKTEPDEATKNRPYSQWLPGDEKRLRRVSATFELGSQNPDTAAEPSTPALETAAPTQEAEDSHHLLGLLFNSEIGLWALLGLAAGFGAVHALTPGHGKTLVAAYLVGEQGTIWHAVLLGLVTTFTHTVIVIALAIWMLFAPWVAQFLWLVSGLLVAGLGFWLFLRRLSGGPDHVHIGGSGHHHHGHGPAAHDHDAQGRARPLPAPTMTSWGLIILGISGGIVPCWDAIAMLGIAIAAGRTALGLPLVLAFSAGLAGVLVLVGILVVRLKGFAQSRWGESRLFRILPLVSAALIFAMGLWTCFAHVQHGSVPRPSVATRP
jgi:ABC-type nickel/cobalt efflux system permease component RcnA